MAIYRLETSIIGRRGRDKDGKVIQGKTVSVVAKAAYRAGQSLRDERSDRLARYQSRAREVVHSEILAPATAPGWLKSDETGIGGGTRKQRQMREQLWNRIEAVEKRSDSQLAREFILSLPIELTLEQRAELVRGWVNEEWVSKGFVADIALHKSKNDKNPHAHVLVTMRPLEGMDFGKKPTMDGKFNKRGSVGFGAKDQLVTWRESWAKHENDALEQAGRDERVTHLSLKDQNIDRIPQPKKGVSATAMERKDKELSTDAGRRLREVKMMNEVMPHLRDIEDRDGVQLHGTGVDGTWWERSISVVTRAAQQVREKVKGAWERFLDSRQQNKPQNAPDLGR